MKTAIELLASFNERMHTITGTCDRHGEQELYAPKDVTEFSCPACADEAQAKAARDAWAAERADLLVKIATVPPKYAGKQFKPTTDEQRAARLMAKGFLDEVVKGGAWAAFVMSGEAGTGKTLMACEMVETFIRKTLRKGRYITAPAMIGEIHQAYSTPGKSEAGEIARFVDYDLLVLDEIDLVRPTDNSQGLLTEVVNARYNADKPIIAITNKPRAELGRYVGSRVDDRLYENGFAAAFVWQSFRRQ